MHQIFGGSDPRRRNIPHLSPHNLQQTIGQPQVVLRIDFENRRHTFTAHHARVILPGIPKCHKSHEYLNYRYRSFVPNRECERAAVIIPDTEESLYLRRFPADIRSMRLQCPKCRSEHLAIKAATGFERVMVFLTRLRTFRCRDCFFDFRAQDRRTLHRDGKPTESMRAVRNL